MSNSPYKKRGSIDLPPEMDSSSKPVSEEAIRGVNSTLGRMQNAKERTASNMNRLQDMLSRGIDLDSPTIARHGNGNSLFSGANSPEPESPGSPSTPTVMRHTGDGPRAFKMSKAQSVPELANPGQSSIMGQRARKRGSFQDATSVKGAQRLTQLGASNEQNSAQALSKWVSGERLQRHEENNRIGEGAYSMSVRQLMKLDDRVNIDQINTKNYQTSHNEDEEEMFNRSMHRQTSKLRHSTSYRHAKTIER